jgi:uncharacterized protein YndB with AHSA1/START domain
VRVDRTQHVRAPLERVWETIAAWQTHPEWQPSLAEVEAPPVVDLGARLVEIRASHGQRLTFDVVIKEFEPRRLIRASGRSRGVVSVSADLVYVLEPAGDATAVTIALEAEIPFVLLPLRHAVTTESEREITEMLARLADREAREAKAS